MDVVVGVVAGALAIAALGFVLLRRQAVKKKDADPRPPHIDDGGDNLEQSRREHEQQPGVSNHSTSRAVVGGHEVSAPQPRQKSSSSPWWCAPSMHHQRSVLPPPHQQHAAVAVVADADAIENCEISQSLSPAPLVIGDVLSGTDVTTAGSGEDGGGSSLAGVGGAEGGSTDQLLSLPTTTMASAANGSTDGSAKLDDGVGTPTKDDVLSLPDAQSKGESGTTSTAGGRRTRERDRLYGRRSTDVGRPRVRSGRDGGGRGTGTTLPDPRCQRGGDDGVDSDTPGVGQSGRDEPEQRQREAVPVHRDDA